MKFTGILFIFTLLFGSQLHAQSALRLKQFNLENGLAIQGYDPVAYFTQGKAIEGSKQFASVIEGVTYRFANTANKELFIKDPKNMSLNTADGVRMPLVLPMKRWKLTPKPLKLSMENFTFSSIILSIIPFLNGIKTKLI